MQKNILIGNGINIQFGGSEYTNRAIVHRLRDNINMGKYDALLPGITAEELNDFLDQIVKIVSNIKKYRPPEEYLFLEKERERISKTYGESTKLDDVALEDMFIVLEHLRNENDTEEFTMTLHREFQQILLDAIFNDGKIQKIDYGEGFRDFLSRYDNVFTINYDDNVDKYCDGKKVHHLHGDFRTLAPEYDTSSVFL